MNINRESTLPVRKDRPVHDISSFSLLDYPDHIAAILWFAGCNMRCLYCYNPEIVFGKGSYSVREVVAFLRSRKGLLDGIVCSGGECTLHKSLPDIACAAKDLGMAVKVDTNGSRPEIIKTMLHEKILDYIALDFKALPDSFQSVTGSNLYDKFEETLELLLESGIPFEVRTTVHSKLISEHDLYRMAEYLYEKGYRNRPYFIQQFLNGVNTIGQPGYSNKYCVSTEIRPPDGFPEFMYR